MQGTPTAVIDKVNHQIYRFDACKTKRITESGKRCEPTTIPREQKRCQSVQNYSYTVTYACTYGLVVVENVIKDFGRPVGVIKDSEGVLLVADDVGNIIWRVAPDTRAN